MKYLKIKKNVDFQKIFKRGKRTFSPSLTLIYIKSSKLSMGVAVSKKHGNAVKRNRIKRLIRAAFYDTDGLIKQPVALIIMPKVAEQYSYTTFKKSLISGINKLNAVCAES